MGESLRKPVTASESGFGQHLVGDHSSFGKYTLIAKIGHGGMAEVFLAAIRGPAGFTKLCVLKRLHPHLEEEPGLIGMFLDEARLAARLNHPNVVQTYEVGDVQGLHFLTMEYLEGQSMARMLRHARRLDQPVPLAVGVRLFIDVLDGLHYAHTLKDFDGTPLHVVHRDISPGNIFITYEGQVKVLDFGIAKAGTQLVETRAGQVKGKFAYIAPEQASPDIRADHRADIWSLGVTMWEAFAGRRLFKGESEVITLHNALNSVIHSLDSQVDVPDQLSRIVERSLQRDPAHRYQSARQMKEDLESFMHDSGLRVSRHDVGGFLTGLFERERDEQRRVLSAYMRGESPGHSMTPVPVSATPPSFSRVQPAPPQNEERKRPGYWVIALIFLLAIGVGVTLALVGAGEDEDRYAVEVPVAPVAPVAVTESTMEPVVEPAAVMVSPTVEAPITAMGQPVVTETAMTETAMTETAMTETAMTEPTVARVEASMRTRDRSRSMRRTMRAPMVEEPVMEAAPQPETGSLTLDTVPWSHVSLNGRRLGTTPLIRESLPAGSHLLTLSNPERGLRTTYRVTIRAGQTTTRRVGIE